MKLTANWYLTYFYEVCQLVLMFIRRSIIIRPCNAERSTFSVGSKIEFFLRMVSIRFDLEESMFECISKYSRVERVHCSNHWVQCLTVSFTRLMKRDISKI